MKIWFNLKDHHFSFTWFIQCPTKWNFLLFWNIHHHWTLNIHPCLHTPTSFAIIMFPDWFHPLTIFIFFQVCLTDPMIIHENALFLGMSLILCKLPTCLILYHYPSLERGYVSVCVCLCGHVFPRKRWWVREGEVHTWSCLWYTSC